MTPTISLSLSRKISELVKVETDFFHVLEKKWAGIYREEPKWKLIYGMPPGNYDGDTWLDGEIYPAYQLHDLPKVLREINEERSKTGEGWTKWDMGVNQTVGLDWKDHFLRICELFSQTEQMGEGSEVEKYIESLL